MNITCDTININFYGYRDNNSDGYLNSNRSENEDRNKDKGYVILNPKSKDRIITVLIIPSRSIFETLADLEKELQSEKYEKHKYLILLDFILLEGHDDEYRYITIKVIDDKIDITTVTRTSFTAGDYYERLVLGYLNVHYYLVRNATLKEEYKEKIRNYEQEGL